MSNLVLQQYFQRTAMDGCFKNPLGIIQQVDEKEQTAYQSIVNMLKPQRSLSAQQNTQSAILKDLDSFHKYYNQKCQQYKESYDRVNQQNWEYASKIIKYEKALENYQLMYFQAKQQIIFMETKRKESQQQCSRQLQDLSCVINAKDQEIFRLKKELSQHSINIEVPKRKIIKLKQKSLRIQQDDPNNIQSARSHRKMNSLKNQLQQYALETQQLLNENDMLRKKVKHLQADRKYEQQRLKNATLSLELDLKIKKQQISRLNHQIEIYEKKFEQLILALKSSHSSSLIKEKQMFCSIPAERNPLSPKYSENWQNIEASQNLTDDKQTQKTHRKLDIETQRTKKKTHKRHGSSNLEQNRREDQKQEFNMKIKIFRFKNKKYT